MKQRKNFGVSEIREFKTLFNLYISAGYNSSHIRNVGIQKAWNRKTWTTNVNRIPHWGKLKSLPQRGCFLKLLHEWFITNLLVMTTRPICLWDVIFCFISSLALACHRKKKSGRAEKYPLRSLQRKWCSRPLTREVMFSEFYNGTHVLGPWQRKSCSPNLYKGSNVLRPWERKSTPVS